MSIHGNAVERGTAFEHMVLDVLKQMSFQIARVGGPGDKGGMSFLLSVLFAVNCFFLVFPCLCLFFSHTHSFT